LSSALAALERHDVALLRLRSGSLPDEKIFRRNRMFLGSKMVSSFHFKMGLCEREIFSQDTPEGSVAGSCAFLRATPSCGKRSAHMGSFWSGMIIKKSRTIRAQ